MNSDFSSQYQANPILNENDWLCIVSKNQVYSVANQVFHRFNADSSIQSLINKPHIHLCLGLWQQQPFHCLIFDSLEHEDMQPLRPLLSHIGEDQFALVGRCLQLQLWLNDQRYCGRCSANTSVSDKELVLVCNDCNAHYYPRISPCVIGIITRGERCLLAHNARFPEGMYSVLAGFMEPGENIEQAFAREVREEVGIEITDIQYISSQVWPFPSQLMIGLEARWLSGEIQVDGEEILHADWFSADKLPQTPPSQTISGKLIEMFSNQRLSE